MQDSTIEVFAAGNGQFMQHIAVCLLSLLRNSSSRCRITVVSNESDTPAESKLRETLTCRNLANLRFARFCSKELEAFPATQILPAETYMRLWMEDYYPRSVSQVLYVDGDMVILGDISEVWGCNLEDRVLAAVPIPGSDRWKLLATPDKYGYFNAGLMVVNLPLWRERRVRERTIEYIRSYPERILDGDQDALNACLFDSWLELPCEWNVISPYYKGRCSLALSDAEIRRVVANAKNVHFNGVSKPWLYTCDHPRRSIYWDYLRQTAWRDYVPPDLTLKNRLKVFARRVLPAWLVRAIHERRR